MLLDRKHRTWSIATTAAVAAASGIYAAYPQLSARPYTGGSWIGLLFGAAAAAAMIFAGLLAVRKAIPLAPIGSAQFWLRGHIWIGLASAPLALYHASFRLGGPLEMALMVCFAVVLVSGVFGLAMQQILPRHLKVRVPLETFPEQIPYLCRRFRAEGDSLIAESCGKLDVEFESLKSEAFQYALAEGKLRNGREQEDFAKLLAAIYHGAPGKGADDSRPPRTRPESKRKEPSPQIAAQEDPARSTAKSAASKKATSIQEKLAQAKAAGAAAKSAAASTGSSAQGATPPAETKLSVQDKLAQAKAAGAAKKAAAAAAEKAAAAAAGANSPEASPPAEKKLSIQEKLAQAKAAGAAHKSSSPPGSNPAPKPAAKSGGQALLEKLAKKGKQEGPVASKEKSKAKKGNQAEPLPRSEELMAFYLNEVRPFLAEDARATRRHPFADETTARMRFANQGRVLSDKLLDVHRRLEELCESRRQYLEQGRIRAWLNGWLFVHTPLSAVLFVLLAVHVVMALRVVPWEL